jgi:hypothetical protein
MKNYLFNKNILDHKKNLCSSSGFIFLLFFVQTILILTCFYVHSNYFVIKAEIISIQNINKALKELLHEIDNEGSVDISKNSSDYMANSSNNLSSRIMHIFYYITDISSKENNLLISKLVKKLFNQRFKRELNDSSFKKNSTRIKKISSTTNSVISSTPIQEIFYIQNKNLTGKDGKESNGITIPNNDHFLIQAYSKISVRIFSQFLLQIKITGK